MCAVGFILPLSVQNTMQVLPRCSLVKVDAVINFPPLLVYLLIEPISVRVCCNRSSLDQLL